MQEPHHSDHHDPPRVALVVAAAVAALVLPLAAGAARFAPLPSPLAPLSPEPPLAGGAAASAENTRHGVSATTDVRVSIDSKGAPFAVAATQRLDVRGTGDYYFTIGAPVLDARRAPGSESSPGFQSGKLVWAGFDPGRKTLAAVVQLDLAKVSGTLPLRVLVENRSTTLVDATGVRASAFTADALRPQLVTYLRRLEAAVRGGRTPQSGGAEVTSEPQPVIVPVVVPLRVTGKIGGRRVSLLLTGRTVVPAVGRVDLRVEPVLRTAFGDLSQLDGRALLALATRASLVVARTRQYLQYLGNPDPAGPSTTTYVYRSAARPAPAVATRTTRGGGGSSWVTSALVALGAAAALALAAVVWARS